MGLLLGLGLALVSEFFDHSLCTREDVERHLGLPLVGSLPESDSIRRPL
jgi:capsular polysaccharide biosynthesis protein